jgi:hypothetical protein
MDNNQIMNAIHETAWTLELASCDRNSCLSELEEKKGAVRTQELKYNRANLICSKLESSLKGLQSLLKPPSSPTPSVYNPETDVMQDRK